MKKALLTILCVIAAHFAFAQSFSLSGDGNWHRVATCYGGLHSYFQYIYSQPTAYNPSIARGEVEFTVYTNFSIQHHETMGYGGWYQPQFALVVSGNTAEIWVQATSGATAGTFTVMNSANVAINSGDLSVANLSSRGGTATIYNKLRDNADTFYSNILVPTGTLSIGTNTIDPSYKLSVEGNIHAQQVNVDMNGWADYVFSKNYSLLSLDKVKTYVDQNHHLPDLPSAQQIEKDGLNLGEMNKLLLKKVEELTLYLIEKDKNDKEKAAQLKKQQEQINVLTEELSAVKQSLLKNK